jgi:hypothetical protein
VSPPLRLFDLIQSHRITQVIHVAAKLGIAEALRQAPRSVEELAASLDVHPEVLQRLMAALATIEICELKSDGRYAISEVGSSLDETSASSLKSWAIFESEIIAANWQSLLDTVRTGLTPAQRAGASNNFELMARSPERVAIFNAAMTDLTRLVTPELLRAYDFSRTSNLLDVGGGAGEFIAEAAKRHPHLRATVFDLPRCEAAALRRLREAGVDDRATFVGGDFFRAIPAIADTILMKSIIHDWDDERSTHILRNCRTALPETGRLLLIERIVAERPSNSDTDRSNAMSDLNMMCGPGGRERTRDDYDRLLATSGFRLETVHAAGRFSVIEAQPA